MTVDSRLPLASLALAFLVFACGEGGSGGDGPTDAGPADAGFDASGEDGRADQFMFEGLSRPGGVRERSLDALGVLRVVNLLTAAELAAENGPNIAAKSAAEIEKFRLGADGRPDGDDDQRLRTLQGLDDLDYLGPKAFSKLLDYARTHGLVPGERDACGLKEPAVDDRELPSDVTGSTTVTLADGSTDRVEIWTNAAARMSATDLANIETRLCDALLFDLETLGLSLDEPELQPAIRVFVFGRTDYDAVTESPGTDGISLSAYGNESDALIVPEYGMNDLESFDDTLVHEMHHVLAGRLAPRDSDITWYMIEGTAINIGAQYGAKLGYATVPWVQGWAEAATAADARTIWSRYGVEDRTTSLAQIVHDEAISGFFVEFLRVKEPVADAIGVPDVQERLLRVMIRASNGEHFADAFGDEIGVSLATAKLDFENFLTATEGDNATRMAGTMYAPKSP